MTQHLTRRWACAAALALALPLMPGFAGSIPAQAQSPPVDEVWVGVLRQQLLADQSCRLALVLDQREVPLGAHTSLEGRIRCHDGREFDFSRQRPHERFQIRLCQPTYC